MSILLQAKLFAFLLFGSYAVWKVFFSKPNSSPMNDKEEKGAQVSFSNEGRGGQVFYRGKAGAFAMYWEFGGGDTIAIIDIPSEQHWETQTKIPLEKRMDILHFIGKKTVQVQTTGGKGAYEIQDNCILLTNS